MLFSKYVIVLFIDSSNRLIGNRCYPFFAFGTKNPTTIQPIVPAQPTMIFTVSGLMKNIIEIDTMMHIKLMAVIFPLTDRPPCLS